MSKNSPYNRGVIRSMLLAVLVAALFVVAATPSFFSSAAASTRQLPVYSVQRDDKCVSLTFDAAWGDVRVR